MSAHLERQLSHIKKMILNQADVVSKTVADAIRAADDRNVSLAERIINNDRVINRMEIDIEEECLHTLACYQPVAHDLRFVVSVLKINNDLERIADMAVNICEQAILLAKEDDLVLSSYINSMPEKVVKMLRWSIESLVEMDPDKAEFVRRSDDEVDAAHSAMYQRVEDDMQKDPSRVPALVDLINISRQLERIADLAVNIAEDVIYIAKGFIARHADDPAPQSS